MIDCIALFILIVGCIVISYTFALFVDKVAGLIARIVCG